MDRTNHENLERTSIGMPRGSLLRIDDGVGVLVHVWEGEVWLTQDGSPRDHMLTAGQSFQVDRGGAALAHAFRRSVISLSSPGGEVQARRVTLVQSGASAPVLLHKRGRFEPLFAFLRSLAAPIRAAA
jgi:hypothetical protein